MFYSGDSESFFGEGSEQWDEYVTGYSGNEFSSGETISEIGRDNPGIDNGGVIEGGIAPAGSGEENLGFGGGSHDGSIVEQAPEEEEASILVEQADDSEELVDFVVSLIGRLEEENQQVSPQEMQEQSDASSDMDSEAAQETEYTIDDLYASLEEIKTCCISMQEDNKNYHIGQDITSRMLAAGLFMILGGVVVYAFVGRIR